MAYNEDSSFKLKSALKDGSNPPFKAMGATDAPTKDYSIEKGSHDHPHSGPAKAMHEAPTKDMHDAPTKFGPKRKTEMKTFPNQKVDPLNIVGGIKQVISDVNTAAGNITSKTQAFGDKVVADAGDAIGQITQPIASEVKNISENISNIAKTDVPRKFVTDVKNLFTNLSAKNKALNEKKRQRDANKPKKEKKKGNIFGK
jgi:hypothetical protein